MYLNVSVCVHVRVCVRNNNTPSPQAIVQNRLNGLAITLIKLPFQASIKETYHSKLENHVSHGSLPKLLVSVLDCQR